MLFHVYYYGSKFVNVCRIVHRIVVKYILTEYPCFAIEFHKTILSLSSFRTLLRSCLLPSEKLQYDERIPNHCSRMNRILVFDWKPLELKIIFLKVDILTALNLNEFFFKCSR